MNAALRKTLSISTACPYCGVGCGLLINADGQGGVSVAGDDRHPANFGRACSKGMALGETLRLDGRLLHPMAREGSGALRRVSWDDALQRVARGLNDVVARHGANAIGVYLSG